MDHPLWLAAAGILVSNTLWLPLLWRHRHSLALPFIVIELLAFTAFELSGHSMLSLVLLTVVAYKLVNFFRVRVDRIQHDFLKTVSWRAQYMLTLVQLFILLLAVFRIHVASSTMLLLVAGFQLVLGLILISSTLRHLKTTRTLQATTAYTDKELPTLSVLVPARNETDDLELCLAALVASNYPKLEIIVLDDCSQSKRTPEIIRSFAHAGVRFIAGGVADDSWLAKNYAYEQLAQAASGDYLLFCGVDLRMTPDAMRELVTTMLEKNKTMLSVLPSNSYPKNWRSRLVQPMRYAWELCLPRRLFSRPPVLSTCWIIERSAFSSAGGFKATSRSILPESHFARFTARADGYSFLRSNMLVSDKSYMEQRATAVRMRYPQLRRRLELVWLLSMTEFIGLTLPLIVFVALLLLDKDAWALIALLAYILQQIALAAVMSVMYGRPFTASGWLAPLHDVLLLNYSMYRYEFKNVIWKDRNVCLPVMRIDSESK